MAYTVFSFINNMENTNQDYILHSFDWQKLRSHMITNNGKEID